MEYRHGGIGVLAMMNGEALETDFARDARKFLGLTLTELGSRLHGWQRGDDGHFVGQCPFDGELIRFHPTEREHRDLCTSQYASGAIYPVLIETVQGTLLQKAWLPLTLDEWADRELAAPDLLLGNLVSTTTRLLLAGATGLGKSNLLVAMGFGISDGTGFLHWCGHRLARVLYVDGEMSRRLLKKRLADETRRHGSRPPTFFAFNHEDAGDSWRPLNSEAGQQFMDGLIARVEPDLVIFDNLQALLSGSLKEPDLWLDTLSWAKSLTARSIGQIWAHHTGHDTTRFYGDSGIAWQMDCVATMEKVADVAASVDIAAQLSFPKARERERATRSDFETVTITLADDRWLGEVEAPTTPQNRKALSPLGAKFHAALLDALLSPLAKVRPSSAGRLSITLDEWRAECKRLGLIEHPPQKDRDRSLFSKYKLELLEKGYATVNGEIAWALN